MTLLLAILALAQTNADFNVVELDLSPGTWRVTVSQGNTWWRGTVEVVEGQQEYTVALQRVEYRDLGRFWSWGPEWAGRRMEWRSEFLTPVRGRGQSRRVVGVVR